MPRTYKREYKHTQLLVSTSSEFLSGSIVIGSTDRVAKLKNLTSTIHVRGAGGLSSGTDGYFTGYAGLYRAHKSIAFGETVEEYDDRRLLRPIPVFHGFNDMLFTHYFPAVDIHEDGELNFMVRLVDNGLATAEVTVIDVFTKYVRHDVTY